MAKENKKVVLNYEDGGEIELEIIKEFEYKGKKYALMFDKEELDCGDDCQCTAEEPEGNIYILEVIKDKEGNETYEEITDEKLVEEVIKTAEQLLFDEE